MQDARLFLNTPLLPVQPGQGAQTARKQDPQSARSSQAGFADILSEVDSQVAFSQHAMQRIHSRGISFSASDLRKLDDTVGKMAEKGARESLVYMNGIALVVSVTNKTVITAMESSQAKQNIFTNIDSAAIL